jgi:hypothetical protein
MLFSVPLPWTFEGAAGAVLSATTPGRRRTIITEDGT